MSEANDFGLSTHINKLAENGFKVNPSQFGNLAAWNRLMLQLTASSHSLERLQKFDVKMKDVDNAFLHSPCFIRLFFNMESVLPAWVVGS
jgi:hypothetical protein